MTSTPHVVVVGAGFAGLHAVRALGRAGLRVTVIDHHPYTTFQPLLYQVATGGLNPGDITYPLRTFASRIRGQIRYRRTSVIDIDTDREVVRCDDGIEVDYDYLLIANGVTANFFGIEGAEQYALPMYTRADAIKVRDTLFGGLERIAGRSERGTGGFTVVIVGGGPTGVELAGTLAEMRDIALPKAFPELSRDRIRVVLAEMAPQLLTPFAKKLQDYTYRQLRKRGVDIRLNQAISAVHADRVEFSGGDDLDVDMVVWAGGVAAYNRVSDWGFEQGKGGAILVGDDLRVKGHDNIFAAGDCARIESNPVAMLAQPAIQGGGHAARQIIALSQGQPTQPFVYRDKGTMATIGAQAAVAQLPGGIRLTRTPAWLLWLGVHIMSLLGGRNRVMTTLNLAARYLSFRRTGAIVGDILDTPARRALDEKEY